MRLLLLVLTAVFDLYGFIIGCILVLCFLIFNKTLSGRSYLNVKLINVQIYTNWLICKKILPNA